MDKVIEGLDLEQIGSPGSVINLDMAEAETTTDKKQLAIIKGEIKSTKNGQQYVVIREGQHYISHMTEQTVEMVKHAMLEEHKTTGRGVDSKKVLEFMNSTIDFLEHGNPTVKDMRSGNPRAVQLLFHMDEMIMGSSKIKKTWAPENKPVVWPEDVPFEDPNNGSLTKKERAAKDGQNSDKKNEKLKKEGLNKMYAFLRREYLSRREEIQQRKDKYVENLPTSLRFNSTNTLQGERLVLLHHRTNGLLLEAVSESSIAKDLSNLMVVMFTRLEEGERMRMLFAEVCAAIQTCIDRALIKDKLDSNALINSLREIHERYKVVTMDNSVQQVSTDTPECYTGLNGFQVQPQETPVLPSPGGWNLMMAQQVLPQAVQQPQHHQQPMISQQPQQQLHQQPQQQLHQQPQQQQFNHQPVSVKQEDRLQQQLKQLNMGDYQMDNQPSTTMQTMYHTGTYRQTPPMYGSAMDYIEKVLPNETVVLGKRKIIDDEILSSSGKTYISLEPQMPATDFTTGPVQISDFHDLLADIEANQGGKLSLAPVTPAEGQELNNQLFAQETIIGNESISVNYWSPAPEVMEVDQ